MRSILILISSVLLIKLVFVVCKDRKTSFDNIALLNDFSVNIEKRIQSANKGQLLSARKYANTQLMLNAHTFFQKLSLGDNAVQLSISKKLERNKQRCIQMGIFAFCRDLFGYLLLNLKPKPEKMIDEMIRNIYNNYERHYPGKTLPFEKSSRDIQIFKTSDNNSTLSIEIPKELNKKAEPVNIKLYMNNLEDRNRTKDLLLQEQTEDYRNFSGCKLLPKSELNEDTILSISNVMKNLIGFSLESKSYTYLNAPKDVFNAVMSDVFNELERTIIQVMNQDLYICSDSLVLEYLYSYYYFACKHIEAESEKRDAMMSTAPIQPSVLN